MVFVNNASNSVLVHISENVCLKAWEWILWGRNPFSKACLFWTLKYWKTLSNKGYDMTFKQKKSIAEYLQLLQILS